MGQDTQLVSHLLRQGYGIQNGLSGAAGTKQTALQACEEGTCLAVILRVSRNRNSGNSCKRDRGFSYTERFSLRGLCLQKGSGVEMLQLKHVCQVKEAASAASLPFSEQ